MHTNTIDAQTESVFSALAENGVLKGYYLAGGTALALQLGHRKSIDLDFFIQGNVDTAALKIALSGLGQFEVTSEDKNTLHCLLDGVKVSFLSYKYNLLFPLLPFNQAGLADERDIAAMKLDAVSSRGSRKDFVDIYFLLEKYNFSELIGFFSRKYEGIGFNKMHILKSLAYFTEAEKEPMPIMLKSVSWDEIKTKIAIQASKFTSL